MKRAFTKSTLALLAVAALAALCGWFLMRRSATSELQGQSSQSSATPSLSGSAAPAGSRPSAPPPPPPAARPDEIEATARVYASHASLRIPEVANPDGNANREILQTMVAKALKSSAQPPVQADSAPNR